MPNGPDHETQAYLMARVALLGLSPAERDRVISNLKNSFAEPAPKAPAAKRVNGRAVKRRKR